MSVGIQEKLARPLNNLLCIIGTLNPTRTHSRETCSGIPQPKRSQHN